jgi:hypothetical protein
MHHLTIYELDAQLVEQLPARELIGRPCARHHHGGRGRLAASRIVRDNCDNGNHVRQFGLSNVKNVGNGAGDINVVL